MRDEMLTERDARDTEAYLNSVPSLLHWLSSEATNGAGNAVLSRGEGLRDLF